MCIHMTEVFQKIDLDFIILLFKESFLSFLLLPVLHAPAPTSSISSCTKDPVAQCDPAIGI